MVKKRDKIEPGKGGSSGNGSVPAKNESKLKKYLPMAIGVVIVIAIIAAI